MAILTDYQIEALCKATNMISPFSNKLNEKGISFGLTSFGYDVRLSNEFVVLSNIYRSEALDPKIPLSLADKNVISIIDDFFCIPPNSFVLGKTIEYLKIPPNVLGIGFGKSTYARNGVIINMTPLEPEWEGYITLSIANLSPCPVKIYANEGIAQITFHENEKYYPNVTYADRKGKYNKQKTIISSRIKK
jgi:dCTP deaminase